MEWLLLETAEMKIFHLIRGILCIQDNEKIKIMRRENRKKEWNKQDRLDSEETRSKSPLQKGQERQRKK